MLWLSEIVLQNDAIDSFRALAEDVQRKAGAGKMYFRMDVKPPFPDSPEDGARVTDNGRLEAAFTSKPKPD